MKASGRDRSFAGRALRLPFSFKALKPEEVQPFVDHLISHAQTHDPMELSDHATLAQTTLRIPMAQVIAYQESFIKNGHFPTAGMLERYHNRHKGK